MISPVEALNLKSVNGVRHGFFTRQGGVSGGIYSALNCGLGSSDDSANVSENRRRVAEHLDANHSGVITLYQIHGATALTVERPVSRDALPKADAIVTATPGLAIGVLTADCTPILFSDFDGRIVAAAHAGWRGAIAGILESTIAEMERLGAQRSRIRAAVGPSINQPAYEVGPDFEAEVSGLDKSSSRFFSRDFGPRPHFDLPGYVIERLARAGITDIEAQTSCTYQSESQFFSYRRSQQRKNGDYGRQISAIVVA